MLCVAGLELAWIQNYDVCVFVQVFISHVSLWSQRLIHVYTGKKSMGNCLFGTFFNCTATIDFVGC